MTSHHHVRLKSQEVLRRRDVMSTPKILFDTRGQTSWAQPHVYLYLPGNFLTNTAEELVCGLSFHRIHVILSLVIFFHMLAYVFSLDCSPSAQLLLFLVSDESPLALNEQAGMFECSP